MAWKGLGSCVDGCIVVLSVSGSILYAYVKGYLHPDHALVVQPYRAPDCRSPPSMPVRYVDCIGRSVHMARYSSVVEVFEPGSALAGAYERLPDPIKEMLDKAPVDWAGLTGSYAVGCEGRESDVDLIVYSREPERLLGWLQRERGRGVVRQCKPQRVISKRRDRRDYAITPQHVISSLVESCYRGVPYTLKILRRLSPRHCMERSPIQIPLGRVRIRADLEADPVESILTPARYRLENASGSRVLKDGDTVFLESFRTRYAGLRSGSYIVEGELFLDVENNFFIISPDLAGGVWRVGE
ncbi:MAG: nucleotidyltransferase domain-containing protein [Desulfurococcales archaeon]|nr:nucleotidyltransferase domain-containing protein [Desulfurococcales archaeon]